MELLANKNKLDGVFELTPIEGRPNVYKLRFNVPTHAHGAGAEMTEADWDKFEKDIEDAFEQVP